MLEFDLSVFRIIASSSLTDLGSAMAPSTPPHPLAQLSPDEFLIARDAIVKVYGAEFSIFFKSISLSEPKRTDLVPFLAAEHDGTLSDNTKRPPRQALVEYDVISADSQQHTRSVVDLLTGDVTTIKTEGQVAQSYYTV